MRLLCMSLYACVLLQVGSSEGADRTFERVHVYQPLEVPSAHTIRKLAAFDGERRPPLRVFVAKLVSKIEGCSGWDPGSELIIHELNGACRVFVSQLLYL
jgi:hypothetical protein